MWIREDSVCGVIDDRVLFHDFDWLWLYTASEPQSIKITKQNSCFMTPVEHVNFINNWQLDIYLVIILLIFLEETCNI